MRHTSDSIRNVRYRYLSFVTAVLFSFELAFGKRAAVVLRAPDYTVLPARHCTTAPQLFISGFPEIRIPAAWFTSFSEGF